MLNIVDELKMLNYLILNIHEIKDIQDIFNISKVKMQNSISKVDEVNIKDIVKSFVIIYYHLISNNYSDSNDPVKNIYYNEMKTHIEKVIKILKDNGWLEE